MIDSLLYTYVMGRWVLIAPRRADLLESDTEPEAAAFFLAPKLVAMGPSKSLPLALLRAAPAIGPRSVSEALPVRKGRTGAGAAALFGRALLACLSRAWKVWSARDGS